MEYKTCPKCGSKHLRIKVDGWNYQFGCFDCGFMAGREKTTQDAILSWDIKVFDYKYDRFN